MEQMRISAKMLRQGAALLGLVSLLVAAVPVAPASAQVLDYGKLFGTPVSEPAASRPQQSRPVMGAGSGDGAGPGAASATRA